MKKSGKVRGQRRLGGRGKSLTQHRTARATFTRNANVAAAEAKKGIGLTTEDNTVLKKRQDRLSNQKAANGVFQGKPGNREKNNAAQRARMDIPQNREKKKRSDECLGQSKSRCAPGRACS